jgi:hypothetical protein
MNNFENLSSKVIQILKIVWYCYEKWFYFQKLFYFKGYQNWFQKTFIIVIKSDLNFKRHFKTRQKTHREGTDKARDMCQAMEATKGREV